MKLSPTITWIVKSGLITLKSLGSATLTVASLMLIALLLRNYSMPYMADGSVNYVIYMISSIQWWVFWANLLFAIIVNYKELEK